MKLFYVMKRKFFNNRVPCIKIFINTSLLFFLFTANSAFAHKVIVFGYVEGDTVFTESKFSSGRKAQNSRITVYDTQGEELVQGRTDRNGAFAFKPPRKTTLKIVLDTGSGHRAEWTIPQDEFDTAPTAPPPAEKLPPIDTATQLPASPPVVSAFTLDDIRIVVANEVEKKIKPVRQMLMQSQSQGPSLQDILGGIGYIFGLMGIAAYFQSKKPKHLKNNDS